LFLPVGIVALVAMGVHLVSDIIVHGVFVTLGAADRSLEAMVDALLPAIESIGWAEPGWAERNTYAFATWIDLDLRQSWSRVGGVVIELLVDFFLVRAALGWHKPTPRFHIASSQRTGFRRVIDTTRIQIKRMRREVRDYVGDLTVEKAYVPLASLCAVIAGCYAVGQALENALFGWLCASHPVAGCGRWLATLPAIAVCLLLGWRMGWRMVVHSLAYCEARSERAHFDGLSARKRRLRGLIPAAIILPVILAAALLGTPLGSWLGIA
jgi:hypothetical protein